ncbi:MAG: LysR family transcriptional regulator [Clostridia bacterium]|nr:LysR family transcriptional regulator [Clostridia bacterium]
MTFKTIEYVIAVHDSGSFSRAAQNLFVSQPALSQAIAKAERELGVEFFVRDTHSLRLTAAGELLVREGRELLAKRNELKTRISGLSAARNETIRLGISPFYSKYYLPAVLPYFRRHFPSVSLEITEEISVVMEQQVIDGMLDFCFVPLYPQNPRLSYEVIHVEEILLAAPRDSAVCTYATPSSGLPYIDLRYLANEPFIGLKSIQKFNEMSDNLCSQAGFKPHIVYETLNWDTVSMLVASGMGVGFVPDVLLNHSSSEKGPQYYHLLGLDALRPYAVACKRGSTLSPLAIQLVEIFKSNIQREKPAGEASSL